MGKKTSFYVSAAIESKIRITDTVGMSNRISRIIDRYTVIIEADRKYLEELFTENEWNAMRQACNVTIWEPASIIRYGVQANIEDSTAAEIEMYDVKKDELLAKLQPLTIAQRFALVELLEVMAA